MDIMIFQSPEISEIQIASGPSTSDKEYLTFFTDYLRLGNLQRKKKAYFGSKIWSLESLRSGGHMWSLSGEGLTVEVQVGKRPSTLDS
jgi:hypothetical protein